MRITDVQVRGTYYHMRSEALIITMFSSSRIIYKIVFFENSRCHSNGTNFTNSISWHYIRKLSAAESERWGTFWESTA